MTNSPSVEHTQDEQHTAEVSKVITMDTKVTFEVTNSNIWLNHLATTTIIQAGDVLLGLRVEDDNIGGVLRVRPRPRGSSHHT